MNFCPFNKHFQTAQIYIEKMSILQVLFGQIWSNACPARSLENYVTMINDYLKMYVGMQLVFPIARVPAIIPLHATVGTHAIGCWPLH